MRNALLIAAVLLGGAWAADRGLANGLPGLGPKPFLAYFRPIPVSGPLSREAWGAATVGPRNPGNGLEDPALARWNYWDGTILRGDDGRYRMFASRWPQARGHSGWVDSLAVEAVADSILGPYRDRGPCWPDDEGGKGHNLAALRLPDGSYAAVASETRNGDVFVSPSIDGPWRRLGSIHIDQGAFPVLGNPGDAPATRGSAPRPWHASNLSLIARPGGGFEIVPRSGQVLISQDGILGPYAVRGDSVYRGLPGLPQDHLDRLEDPVIWFSGGWYHLLVNNWGDRRAYHLISRDGIAGWRFQGLAYEPGAGFLRYADGTVNHWNKLERPGILIENGHVTALTLAVVDVPKEEEKGNDGHGSKVVVVPFDGVALDRDLADADRGR